MANETVTNETNLDQVNKPIEQKEEIPVVQEKMIPQSKVDQIVKTAKIDSYNKGKNEATVPTPIQNNPAQSQQIDNNAQGSMSADNVRKIVEEERARAAQQAMTEKIANEFVQKIESKKTEGKYQDYSDVINSLQLHQLAATAPEIIHWSNSMDNTGDIMYELGKYPSKLSSLLVLAKTAPHLAIKELQSLSSSIKQNDASANQLKAAEPLSQVKPSTTGTDSGSLSSVSDFRKQRWLKG